MFLNVENANTRTDILQSKINKMEELLKLPKFKCIFNPQNNYIKLLAKKKTKYLKKKENSILAANNTMEKSNLLNKIQIKIFF